MTEITVTAFVAIIIGIMGLSFAGTSYYIVRDIEDYLFQLGAAMLILSFSIVLLEIS